MKQFDKYWVFVRYFSTSAFVYIFILLGMYMLVEMAGVGKITSYVIVYCLAYVTSYTMALKLVFRSDHHWLKVIKFIINTMLFLALGAMLFDTMVNAEVNYLIATIAVALVLLPFRFVSNKYFVYR